MPDTMPASQPDAISLVTVAAPPAGDREGWRAGARSEV